MAIAFLQSWSRLFHILWGSDKGSRHYWQGIVGESYARLSGETPFHWPEPISAFAPRARARFQSNEGDYVIQDYFFSAAAHDLGTVLSIAPPVFDHKRRLIERVKVAFPLMFRSRGVPSDIRLPSPSAFSTGIIDVGDSPKTRRRLIENVSLPRKLSTIGR